MLDKFICFLFDKSCN